MASSLCLLSSRPFLLQRPSNADNSCSKSYNPSRSASPSTSFIRLAPIRDALHLGRLQITRGLKLRRRFVVRMAPDLERLTRRNPLDFPAEWDKPRNPRRPDILPQFSPLKTPLPPPMPFDPPLEDDEEEGEEQQEQPQEQEEEQEEEEGDEE
ncbi:hypothetical protein SUGI_0491170 [Cryptomeria japonica]|uniref:uncharacterized protein LOC131039589 n=1 Tax=Cryptomeria japonica TaxID=3369 RepID=UPI00240892CB|nr:uncharacterized protein LOC131039589 [Cryptomeria japonica]GLJ25640.1 hypothetical protein SUGI_0491170 [Cryptomeria japonica]